MKLFQTCAVLLLLEGISTVVSDEQQEISPLVSCTATCPACPAAGQHGSNPNHIEELIKTVAANSESIKQLNHTLSHLLNKPCEHIHKEKADDKSQYPPNSCQEIKQRKPASPSGLYTIAGGNGTENVSVYCSMETLCDSDSGWTRLAHVNMTHELHCPGGLRLYEADGIRACGRPVSHGGSCHSILYPSHGVQYSEICGRVRGYQYASPDAVDSTIGTGHHNDINGQYVDGLSLTRGNPRKHIWTYMAGLKEDNSHLQGRCTCPCQEGSKQTSNVPYFIEKDYYCESGNPAEPSGAFSYVLYTADPLWDGEKCRSFESPCCNEPNLPWFYKPLETNTTDFIEVRVCADQNTNDEDVAIEQLEIFVK